MGILYENNEFFSAATLVFIFKHFYELHFEWTHLVCKRLSREIKTEIPSTEEVGSHNQWGWNTFPSDIRYLK